MSPGGRARLFRGSELPVLLILAALMVIGWGLVWYYAHHVPPPAEEVARATPRPEPVVPDRSPEFETVTDRTPMSFRDNAAYAHLLEKARGLAPGELARQSRRDILLTHLWERPENYRGVPVHLLGTAMRVLRFESKLSKTGWIYEAWIITPEARKFPYTCVFEDAPEGFPIGPDVAERVVFNGFFLKVMKYQAGDVARGAPVLIGKIGWERHAASPPVVGRQAESNPILYWTLVVLGVMFLISMGRWIYQLFRFMAPAHGRELDLRGPVKDLRDDELDAWVHTVRESKPDDIDLNG
jgi:hypothetical protein